MILMVALLGFLRLLGLQSCIDNWVVATIRCLMDSCALNDALIIRSLVPSRSWSRSLIGESLCSSLNVKHLLLFPSVVEHLDDLEGARDGDQGDKEDDNDHDHVDPVEAVPVVVIVVAVLVEVSRTAAPVFLPVASEDIDHCD